MTTVTLPSAIDRLRDYERRSLAHVAGSPLAAGVAAGWRGLAWRVGRHRLVSAFDEVVEILGAPAVDSLPGAQPWLRGLANVRGNLLPVVDLKHFLEGQRSVAQERQRMLVIRQPGGDVGVLIDELFGQRVFEEEHRIEVGVLAPGRYAYFVDRAYRLDGVEWAVFSLDRLSRTPEFRQAAA
ncbi:chemotaxis protein CheW [Lysobacter pythonis]|uniref:Chemotaxis protein CheW n=1 Tax=Solilutibacter pythonis TaxID=2483112 RepID=A0A3M2I2R2_9GAMM|nr:chemotaxis protein CheW [Lysobacter pythonis]RMH93512.1 chemotaxis protein CheW [Lysobacter pythonis]